MKKLILIIILAIFASISYIYRDKVLTLAYFMPNKASGPEEVYTPPPPPEKQDRVALVEITDGSTYGSLTDEAGLDFFTASEIYDVAYDFYDLARIRLGRHIELIYDKDTDKLKELRYKVDTEDELVVKLMKGQVLGATETDASTTEPKLVSTSTPESEWRAEIISIPYEVKTKVSEGTVESSMYQAALDNEIDIRAIIELANVFQWSIDFAMDPRVGDEFKFVYEERYLDGEYVMPGQVLAGYYINDGVKFQVYYFEESEENKGFFDEEGNSVQKMFLKAPVAFKYISSGFTTGMRYVEAFNVSTGHRAIDYAAPVGTPIRAVGDGTVRSAGWNSSGYGYLTSIRHNGTYATNYAHQSKIAVRVGQKVKQGDTIGYVGSTGFSTGPHLHYEMLKNGVKINPLTEVLPPGKPIKDENKERFFSEMEKYQAMLD